MTFSRSGGTTIIDVLSQDAVIDFPRFGIRPGASVTVEELSQSSVLVGDVLHGPALIAGTLTANGQLVLIDPAGIDVGPHAYVSAAGLVLSTAAPTAASLATLATQAPLDFALPGKAGAGVVNRGKIDVSAGAAILAGETVTNNGLIAASLGSVVLAGTKTYTIDFTGDGLLRFAVAGAPVDSVSSGKNALVANTGTIVGGTVLLTAQAAKDVLDTVINTSGIIEATSAQDVGGKIVLLASGGGTSVSGTLDASGKAAGTSGGTVEVLGDNVTLASTARIDVSGASGGGTALVGGNFHGAGPQPDATTTTVAQGAVIDADALASGNGGNVAIWSNAGTVFDGSITARGGAAGGNGGSVETSGGALTVGTGSVDTMAAAGKIGTWLLDPTNIVVASGGSGTIDPSAIDNATSNVLLQAASDITFVDPIDVAATGVGITAKAGDSITVENGSPITTNGGSIIFSANDPSGPASGSGSIVIDAPLSTAGPDPTRFTPATGGMISLTVNGGTGALSLGANLTTASGAITIAAPATILTGNAEIDTTGAGETVGAGISVAGTVDADLASANRDLELQSGNATTIVESNVGANTPLGNFGVGDNGGTIAVEASVFTSGEQLYSADAVELDGTQYHAGLFVTSGVVQIGPGITEIDAGDIHICCTLGGPGGLVLNAGPSVAGFDATSGYDFPSSGNIVLDNASGVLIPLASLRATAAGAIVVGNAVYPGIIVTVGPQSYSDQTLYLAGPLYQTNGASFAQHGATILGTPPEDDSDGDGDDITFDVVTSPAVLDPAIDTTGAGADPAGAAITFTSPGSVDGDEAFALTAGRSAITLGPLGGTTPIGPVTIMGGSVTLSGPADASSFDAVVTPDPPAVTFSAAPSSAALLTDTTELMSPGRSDIEAIDAGVIATTSNAPPLLTILALPVPLVYPAAGPDGDANQSFNIIIKQ